MTTDEQSADNPPVWGAPRSRPRWGMRQTVAAAGVAAVIAALGGAAIYAATDGASTSMRGPMGPPPGADGPGGPDMGRSLHAEWVVDNPDGGYATKLSQTGAVTGISPVTVTVRSDDGFTQTYPLPANKGAADSRFAVHDKVTVQATRNGHRTTVTDIDAG